MKLAKPVDLRFCLITAANKIKFSETTELVVIMDSINLLLLTFKKIIFNGHCYQP